MHMKISHVLYLVWETSLIAFQYSVTIKSGFTLNFSEGECTRPKRAGGLDFELRNTLWSSKLFERTNNVIFINKIRVLPVQWLEKFSFSSTFIAAENPKNPLSRYLSVSMSVCLSVGKAHVRIYAFQGKLVHWFWLNILLFFYTCISR